MSRWTGSWLAGPQSAGSVARSAYPGERFGLPESGPGAAANIGRRCGQFLLDIAMSWLAADALFPRYVDGVRTPQPWASVLIYALECVVLLVLTGQTAGMRLTGLRVVRVDGGRANGGAALGAAVVRTVLTLLLVPILFFDHDLRGLHDRAVGVAVVRTRG